MPPAVIIAYDNDHLIESLQEKKPSDIKELQLHSINFNTEVNDIIFDSIQNSSLAKLSVESSTLDDDFMMRISEELHHNKNLKKLELTNNEMENDYVTYILENCRYIEELKIGSIELTNDHFNLIFRNKLLRKLDINSVTFDFDYLSSNFDSFPLTHLTLKQCNFIGNTKNFGKLFNNLVFLSVSCVDSHCIINESSNTLRYLKISDFICIRKIKNLLIQDNLRNLDISRCKIQSQLRDLSEYMNKIKNLCSLSITDCDMRNIKCLISVFPFCIRNINFRFNSLSDDSFYAISELMKRNKNIQSLNLESNSNTLIGCKYILKEIEKNYPIRYMNLTKTPIYTEGYQEIFESSLMKNRFLIGVSKHVLNDNINNHLMMNRKRMNQRNEDLMSKSYPKRLINMMIQMI